MDHTVWYYYPPAYILTKTLRKLNFQDDSIHASMEEPSGDWPFGEELEIRATQNNRGTIQIDTGKFSLSDARSAAMKSSFATFSVTPSVANVSPRIGSHLGGAIMTISGKGKHNFYSFAHGINIGSHRVFKGIFEPLSSIFCTKFGLFLRIFDLG